MNNFTLGDIIIALVEIHAQTGIKCHSCDNMLDVFELRDNEGYCDECYK